MVLPDHYNPRWDRCSTERGDISHSDSSYFYADVTGPDTISFWWKVSSESNYDWLYFYDGTTQKNRISGSQDWEQQIYDITSGSHRLKWQYKKDGSQDAGSDCGWVDQIGWNIGTEEIPTPTEFNLSYSPNPARNGVEIRYAIPEDTRTSIRIYDCSGKLVTTLVDKLQKSAYYSITWDGRDAAGNEVCTGIYFCQIKAGDFTARKKLVLIR